MKTENVEFLCDRVISDFITDDRITGAKKKNVNTNNISTIKWEGIFISIGRKPATEFLIGNINLDNHGYIIADESTRTNITGVYAAGDVRTKALRQVVTAVSDGAAAVHFAEEYLSENKFKA